MKEKYEDLITSLLDQLSEVAYLIDEFPNDMELGQEIRKRFNKEKIKKYEHERN